MSLYNRGFLITNLSFVYRLIVASAPLLEFAIPRSVGPLKRYYEEHLVEESGHDLMLQGDLAALGVQVIPRYHAAVDLAGAQYYLIAHEHPAALLGYMHVLERDTVPLAMVDELEQLYGVELKALRHHSEHDPEHVKALDEQIAVLPVQLRALVDWNGKRVIQQLQMAFSKMAAFATLE